MSVVQAIEGHLEVRQKLADAQVAAGRIAEVEVSGRPTLDFTTAGRYPIDSELGDAKARVSESDESYIDGVFLVNAPLFDFGKRDSQRLSETLKYLSVQDDLYSLKQNLAAELLANLCLYYRYMTSAELMESAVDVVQKAVEIEKRRYRNGVGSLGDIRALEIRHIEYESDLAGSLFRRDDIASRTERDFDFSVNKDDQSSMKLVETLPMLPGGFDIEKSARLSSLEKQRSALAASIESIERSNLPEIIGSVTTTFYDVDVRLGRQYEIVGGLSASIPLFDGGSKANQIEIIRYQIDSIEFEVSKLKDDLAQEWKSAMDEIVLISNRMKDALKGLEEKQAKRSESEQRAASLEGSQLAVVEAKLSVIDQQIEINSMYWDQRALLVGAYRISESFDLSKRLLDHNGD